MNPLRPDEAVAYARDLLLGRGFQEVGRSRDGASVYLRRPGALFDLRVSTHRRTPKRRRQYPEVAASLLFRERKSRDQVGRMVEAALRAFDSACLRRHRSEQGPP